MYRSSAKHSEDSSWSPPAFPALPFPSQIALLSTAIRPPESDYSSQYIIESDRAAVVAMPVLDIFAGSSSDKEGTDRRTAVRASRPIDAWQPTRPKPSLRIQTAMMHDREASGVNDIADENPSVEIFPIHPSIGSVEIVTGPLDAFSSASTVTGSVVYLMGMLSEQSLCYHVMPSSPPPLLQTSITRDAGHTTLPREGLQLG